MKKIQLKSDLSQFVDREEETTTILNDIYDNINSKIAIIAASTAIGKSAVAQKILSTYCGNKMIVRIKTMPQNVGNNPNEWEYFEAIFQAISKACKNRNQHNLTFEYFINNDKSKITNKELLSALIDDLAKEQSKISYLLVLLSHLLKRAFHIGIYDSNKISSSNSLSARRIKAHYIDYVFEKLDLIINIDNIQNIDYTSMNHLIKWIGNYAAKGNYYLFEYTLSEQYTRSSLQQFQNYLSTSEVSSDIYFLEKISSEYIIDIVSKHTDIPIENRFFSVKLLEYYKNDDSGNIRKAIDFSINYTSNNGDENLNPTLSNLLRVSDNGKYILAVIIMHNGRITYEELSDIVTEKFITTIKLNKLLEELNSHLIISMNSNTIEIKHASIIDSWNSSPTFEQYIQMSYIDYEKYLLNKLRLEKDESNIAWVFLLQLYSTYNPSKIRNLLEYLNNGMIHTISPQNAWTYMEMLIEKTSNKVIEFKSMYYEILKICFESELYEEGYRCIRILEAEIPLIKDHNLLLHKCMYLSALDEHDENIKLCEEYMEKTDKLTRVYLNLCLIAMSSYRSTNQKEKCFKLFKEIESEPVYKGYIEYGYFLRLTCMYLPRKEGAKYIKKSINFFKRCNDYHQAGKSLISYAYAQASLKKYNKALKSIKQAQKYLKDKKMGQHMFLVNMASILLSKNIFDDFTWECLDKAEISARVPFDRLAIILNKIIWCIENESYSQVRFLINTATNLTSREPDKHIHALLYYNIYLFYKKVGNEEQERIYYNKAYEVRDWCIPMKEIMEGGKNQRKHEWYNCFLEYWTYDLFEI